MLSSQIREFHKIFFAQLIVAATTLLLNFALPFAKLIFEKNVKFSKKVDEIRLKSLAFFAIFCWKPFSFLIKI